MKKIKVGIVDDSEVYRETITRQLELESDFNVSLVAASGTLYLEKIKESIPDVTLMDVLMPNINGVETSRLAKRFHPDIKIIAFSSHTQSDNIIDMSRVGVNSFIGKGDDITELFKAIRTVFGGGYYLTNYASEIITGYINSISKYNIPTVLTDNEKLLIRMILEGCNSKVIGERICKSYRTVEDMRERIYDKLKVKNKIELVALASRWDKLN